MAIIKWVFWITIWVLVAAFFHYTLPQVDIVRVTDTYEKRVDPGENSIFWAQADIGTDGTLANRDVFFIQTRRAKGDVMVYRNEDTGWGWPPYFKFDTSNLQAEAADAKSTEAAPEWYAIKHYGWRNEFLTVFPNAISLRKVEGPDASKGIPWLNIIILTLFFAIVYAIWVRWRRFRRARIDPTLEALEDDLAEKRQGMSRWIGSWRAKK
ncbi:DUF1523 family protein [Sulfitobacter sp. PR48]|jgi:hypothetical protein|uniref:DUF1523 family protein n=1 Tax=Sulfitobacter porphyrae TaxID=1246864 RepID=A0ABW2AZ90_9RHOB|nr:MULTISPECIES: DUF1523 family protein [unclassified Sulfitobacter]MCZ4257515.1 DUF1523 family protein [Sulfitobacter sp. G21635-S1]MDD9719886.1 DUF1523 family protein [Sulfitobacter sp. PR48]GLT08873.1 hypothetical protein GCM10007928_11050 [Sulfitobacter porphyrae]